MSQQQQHAQEPWRAKKQYQGWIIVCDEFGMLADLGHDVKKFKVGQNARRIVACVNACKGIPTESLEREADLEFGTFNMRKIAEQQRDELLAACEKAKEWLEGWASAEQYLAILNKAIAKAKGGAA